VNHRQPILILSLPFLLCAARLSAQDPAEEIKQIVQRIDEQMRTIDQWLLESAKKGEAASKGHDLLQKGQQHSDKVVEGIDELIQKLQQMRQQSQRQSQSQDQDQQQQDQQQQQQQRQRNQQNRPRNENERQEFVQQEPQEGQQQQPQQGQPQPQPGRQNPDGPEASREPGENRPGNQPPDNGTEKVAPGTGDGTWGELPTYANFLKSKGSAPKVPEKFRKYYEGYLKEEAGKGKGK
jgi:hypothetical protein